MPENKDRDPPRPPRRPPPRAYKMVFPGSWLVIIILLIVAGALAAFLVR